MSLAALPEVKQSKDKSPWLVSPAVDLLIGCGAWTIPILLGVRMIDMSGVLAVSALFYFLTIFCNNPHYMATIYRAYGTPQDFQKYKLFTVYLTVLIALSGIIVHFSPILIPILFTIYITWSPWHYTAQNYGIGMMFARRAGANPSPLVRYSTYIAYVASFVMWFLMVHSTFSENAYVISLGIDSGIATIGAIVCTLVFFLGAGIACVTLVSQHGFTAMLPFLTLFSTQLFWFVLPLSMRGMNFADATPVYFSTGALAFMHCSQYLWITQYYAHRERETDTPWLGWNTAKYYGLMIIGGIALFLPGPWLMSRVFSFNLIDSYLIFVSLVNIHHFMLDGAIWKLRDGRIAALLLNAKNAGSKSMGSVPMVSSTWKWVSSPTLPARAVRYTAIGLLLSVAAIDQLQYYLTTSGTNSALSEVLNPNDSRVYQARAQQLIEAGDLEGARKELERALEIEGLNPQTRRMIGNVLLEQGDLEGAWARFEELHSMVRPDLPTLVNTGVLSIQRGNLLTARESLEEALSIDPSRQDARLNLAELFFEMRDFRKSTPLYSEYLDRAEEPTSPEETTRILAITQRLGISLARSGERQEGLKFIEQSANLALQMSDLDLAAGGYREMASLYQADRKFPQAAIAFRRAILIAEEGTLPSYPVYLYDYAGLLLDAQDMKPEALALMETALNGLTSESNQLAPVIQEEIDLLKAAMPPEEVARIAEQRDVYLKKALEFSLIDRSDDDSVN